MVGGCVDWADSRRADQPRDSASDHTVLVTGATGFLGRKVVDWFVQAGHPVVAASRRAVKQTNSFPPGVRTVHLDVTNPSTIESALEGVGIVVHTAAKTGDWGRAREFDAVIRSGTQNLIEACLERPLERFVHVSSALFYGTVGRGVMTEGMLPGHSREPYTEAKIAAEQVVKRAREERGLKAVILRPGNIFGPGSELWTERPAQAIRYGLMSLPSDCGKANPVYIDNVVAAVGAVSTHEAAVGDTFNVVDDDVMKWDEFFGAYAEVLGRGPIARHPPWLLYGLARVLELVSQITRRPPLLTRTAVTHVRFGGTYARGKLEQRVGYERPVGFEEALRRTTSYVKQRYTR